MATEPVYKMPLKRMQFTTLQLQRQVLFAVLSEFYKETVRNALYHNRACSDEKLWLLSPWTLLQLGVTTAFIKGVISLQITLQDYVLVEAKLK